MLVFSIQRLLLLPLSHPTNFLVVLLATTFIPPWNVLPQGNVSLGTWSGWKGQRQIEFKGGKTLGATQISGRAIHSPRLHLHAAKIACPQLTLTIHGVGAVNQELWISVAVADSEIQVHGMSNFRP